MNKPLVSICCLTYNHEKYIRDCLEGFLMQKTNFPFEVLIHDDASTDHTADIIREYEAKYPDIIKPIYQTENQYSKGVSISATYNYSRAQGKYIAKCEGDDFWDDPHKLQMQYDFMERHPDYSICGCKSHVLNEVRKRYIVSKNSDPSFNRLKQQDEIILAIINHLPFSTLSVFFRTDALRQRLPLIIRDTVGKPMGDIQLLFHLSLAGRCYASPRAMVTYRIHKGSASNYYGGAHTSFERKCHEAICELLKNNNFEYLIPRLKRPSPPVEKTDNLFTAKSKSIMRMISYIFAGDFWRYYRFSFFRRRRDRGKFSNNIVASQRFFGKLFGNRTT